jgi:hypothetical protein
MPLPADDEMWDQPPDFLISETPPTATARNQAIAAQLLGRVISHIRDSATDLELKRQHKYALSDRIVTIWEWMGYKLCCVGACIYVSPIHMPLRCLTRYAKDPLTPNATVVLYSSFINNTSILPNVKQKLTLLNRRFSKSSDLLAL